LNFDPDAILRTSAALQLNVSGVGTGSSDALLGHSGITAAVLRRRSSHHLGTSRVQDDNVATLALVADVNLQDARGVYGQRVIIRNAIQAISDIFASTSSKNNDTACV
jgi:hypothetical protein